MIQSEADILLIDEVLAVGDASFQQKCADVFIEMRAGRRTVVLVTHDMAAVQRYCDRAMVLEGGSVAVHRRSRGGRTDVHRRPTSTAKRPKSTTSRSSSSRSCWSRVRRGPASRMLAGGASVRSRLGSASGSGPPSRRAPSFATPESVSTSPTRRAPRCSPCATRPWRAAKRLPSAIRPRSSVEVENPLPRGATGCSAGWSCRGEPNEYAQQGVKLVEFEVGGPRPRGRGLRAGHGKRRVVAARIGQRRDADRSPGAAPDPGPLSPRWRLEALRRPALPHLGHRVQAGLLRDGPRVRVVAASAPAPVRGPALRLHQDLPDRLAGGELSRPVAPQHRALRLLPGRDDPGGPVGRRPRGNCPEDAIPPAGDPDGDGRHRALQPRREPGCRGHLPLRLRRDPDVELVRACRSSSRLCSC